VLETSRDCMISAMSAQRSDSAAAD
jgi:hypothetical protein